MLVFKRLTALAVTIFIIGAGGGVELAQLGQPAPWQLGMQHAATPVMDNIIWFHDYLLVIIALITAFVLALLVVDGAIQRPRQSDAVADHAQHADRGAVDAHSR